VDDYDTEISGSEGESAASSPRQNHAPGLRFRNWAGKAGRAARHKKAQQRVEATKKILLVVAVAAVLLPPQLVILSLGLVGAIYAVLSLGWKSSPLSADL
jgi:hypothetical protein